MKLPKNKLFFDSDKYLISEQPGLKILTMGIAIAMVLGLFARALMNPGRMKQMVEEAGTHIHKDIKVNVDSAELSLAKGWLPRFSVVVSGVRMESNNSCWMSPELLIDQVEIPVSVWSFIKSKTPIRKIFFQNVSLRFFGEFQDCSKNLSGLQVTSSKKSTSEPSKSETLNQQDIKSENDDQRVQSNKISTLLEKSQAEVLETIEIEHLTLEHKKYPTIPPLELTHFEIFNLNPEKRHILLEAQLGLFRDPLLGEYQSKAHLSVEYSEFPETLMQVHFFGNWREGYYSLLARSQLSQREFDMEGEIKQIPLSQIFTVLKYWGLSTQDITNQQIWVSGRLRTSGKELDFKQTPVEISELRVEGDIGDLLIDKVLLGSLQPFKVEPFVVQVNKLDLDSAISLFDSSHSIRPTFVSRLGNFKGNLEVTNSQDLKLAGGLSGIEFIFSNKGQRVMQVVTTANAEAQLSNDQLQVNISNMELLNGSLDGFMSFSGDRQFKNYESLIHAEKVDLDPDVQSLMTNGGHIGPVVFEMRTKAENGKIKELGGKFLANSIEIEGMSLENLRMHLDSQRDSIVISTELKTLKIDRNSESFNFVEPILDSSWYTDSDFKLDHPQGQFRWSDGSALSWKSISATTNQGKVKFLLDGGWSDLGELDGKIIVKSGKAKTEWMVKGNRMKPELRPASINH